MAVPHWARAFLLKETQRDNKYENTKMHLRNLGNKIVEILKNKFFFIGNIHVTKWFRNYNRCIKLVGYSLEVKVLQKQKKKITEMLLFRERIVMEKFTYGSFYLKTRRLNVKARKGFLLYF